eukprot:TRINITY_DN8192_c0_g1_i1.p1 TRINITY_DN8192_c0_g1~~TRINITY_DN8192_c0_g1_i1.p1  ORF type:complete len:325 (-),score=14.97 TRINITY_DN8192_c0_g1_i1:235-1209(-)
MDETTKLVIDCLSSGLVSGLATLLASTSIERFGGVVGGIIGTVPTTIVVSAVGLSFLEGLPKIDETLNIVPSGMLLCLVVLVLWRTMPRILPRSLNTSARLIIMLLLSLTIWCGMAYGLIVVFETYQTSEYALIGSVSLGCYFIIAALVVFIPDLPVSVKGEFPVTKLNYFVRFLLGFFTTASVILLAKWNPYAGGIAMSFPSVILTSMGSLWFSQSESVAVSSASPLILGSTTNSIFGLTFAYVAKYLIPLLGHHVGLAITVSATWFLCVYGFSLPMVILLRKKELNSIDKVPRITFSSIESEDTSSSFLQYSNYNKTTTTIQ